MADYALIEVERADGYAVVAWNRPQRLNAIVPQMLAEFEAAMADLDADPAIEVVILTGRGKAFCAGLDVEMLSSAGSGAIAGFQPARTITEWKGPVIAAINGAAATGGFEMTVACDIIIAAESARFVDTHSRVGLFPGWGISARLQRAIGIYRAKELELTGRPLHAREAEAWGLVNKVVPDKELLPAARAMAELILAGAPRYAAQGKAVIDGGSLLPLGEALKFERQFAIEQNAAVTPGSMKFDHVGGSRG